MTGEFKLPAYPYEQTLRRERDSARGLGDDGDAMAVDAAPAFGGGFGHEGGKPDTAHDAPGPEPAIGACLAV